MRRSTATYQWCWPQCRQDETCPNRLSRWPHPGWGDMTSNFVSQRLSADLQWTQSLQIFPNSRTHWKLSVANNVWTGKDRNLGSQATFDKTIRPDTCRNRPPEWLTRNWFKQLTRQAQQHLSINPASKLLDGDHHCNDPKLPNKLTENCVYSMCEERPATLRLVRRIPRCSFCVVLPNWCSETKS